MAPVNVSGSSSTDRHTSVILWIATLTERRLVMLMAAAYLGVKNSVHFLSLDNTSFLSVDQVSNLHHLWSEHWVSVRGYQIVQVWE